MSQAEPAPGEGARAPGAAHWVVLALVLVLAAVAAHRVVAVAMSDHLATRDPDAALDWNPEHPDALVAQARSALDGGDTAAARQLARQALASAPLHGPAFSMLAEISARAGDPDALELASAAVRRNPRDLRARIRLAEAAVGSADFDAAMAQFDVILRLAPAQRAALLPQLLAWSAHPPFAEALARTIARGPAWRPAMLREMDRQVIEPPVRALYTKLREAGGLSRAETDRWLDALIRAGDWGAAYAHWASQAATGQGSLPAVYNGGFETPPSGSGFDWRMKRVPGTATTVEPLGAGGGHAARIDFLGRQVRQAGLEQALLLPPGRFRVGMRVRAQGLRSDQGLEWRLECAGKGGIAGRSGRLQGDHGWREAMWEAVVPAEDCPGQWLRLHNPAPKGSASLVTGSLWVDDVAIAALEAEPSPGHPDQPEAADPAAVQP